MHARMPSRSSHRNGTGGSDRKLAAHAIAADKQRKGSANSVWPKRISSSRRRSMVGGESLRNRRRPSSAESLFPHPESFIFDPQSLVLPPTFDQRIRDSQLVAYPRDDKIDQIADEFHAVIESGRGRQDHGAGLGGGGHVAKLDQRQRRLPRHEDQPSPLLQVDFGGAVDQVEAAPLAIALSVPPVQGQTTMPSVGNEPLAIGARLSPK